MARHGFVKIPYSMLGYWQLADTNTHISEYNGGDSHRSRLAYMIRAKEKAIKKSKD
jgi:hypothetical protein